MKPTGFEDKLLAKLDKIHVDQIQNHLARVLAQRQFFQTIFEHLDEGVLVTNDSLRLLFANRRARLMLGWGRKENLGEDLAAQITIPDLATVVESLRGRARAIEAYECPGASSGRTLSLTAVPMSAGEGDGPEEPRLLLILLRDVTERHKRQSDQVRAQRLASLAMLTSGVAHEIKNPLNSLNIHAQLLKQEVDRARRAGRAPDLDDTERAAQVILEETARMSRIIEQFIQAARPRTPQLERRLLQDVLASVERVFRPECEKLGIEFSLSVDPEMPPILIDEHLIVQALRNLVRNAIEALGEKTDQARGRGESFAPRIWLDARTAAESLDIIVTDNGPGIAEGAVDHIFEPYFTTKFEGSGLGLMIVFRIVSEHRGAIHVDTKPGEGTRFMIALPIDKRPIKLLDHLKNNEGESHL